MQTTPFIKIFIGNDSSKELRYTIESFEFEDCVKQDSLLNIRMAIPKDYNIAEDPYIKNGTPLIVSFGYLQGLYSENHQFRVSDLNTNYAERITLSMKCLDMGSVLKKTSTPKIWKNKTTIEIITEIVQGYGLEFEYDEDKTGHRVWESIPQGNKGDFNFIRYLVSREKGGNYLFYVRNQRAYLVQRANEESSIATYTYGDGSGVVISFEPSYRESTQTGAGSAYGIRHNKIKVENNSESPTDNKFYFDADANDVTNRIKKETEKIGTPEQRAGVKKFVRKVVNTAVGSVEEAEDLSAYNKMNENAKILHAKLVIVGDPTIIPNTVINMQGVFKQHQGAWLITKVSHRIDSSGGYVTTLEMDKGYKKNTSKGPKKKVNGRKEAPKTGPIIAYDANANEVYVDKLAYDRKIIGSKKSK